MKSKIVAICLFVLAVFAAHHSMRAPEAQAIGQCWQCLTNCCHWQAYPGSAFCLSVGNPPDCSGCVQIGQCSRLTQPDPTE
jgi:hypothetical protein